MTNDFALANDPPRRTSIDHGGVAMRQRRLFAGLDCLPGQEFLFETDGEPPEGGDQIADADRAAG